MHDGLTMSDEQLKVFVEQFKDDKCVIDRLIIDKRLDSCGICILLIDARLQTPTGNLYIMDEFLGGNFHPPSTIRSFYISKSIEGAEPQEYRVVGRMSRASYSSDNNVEILVTFLSQHDQSDLSSIILIRKQEVRFGLCSALPNNTAPTNNTALMPMLNSKPESVFLKTQGAWQGKRP